MERESRYVIASVERVLKLLDCFTIQRPELTLTEITELLDIRKGTVYRFLCTLSHLGYLEYQSDTRRYRLGRKLLSLGHVARKSTGIQRQALPHMMELAKATNENVNLAVLEGNQVLFLERVESQQMVVLKMRVGSRLSSVHASSIGKVVVAHLPADERRRIVDSLTFETYTPRTITDPERFEAELKVVKQQGYALSDEELAEGLVTIAAPIRGWDGRVIAAVNVACLRHRVTMERIHREFKPLLMAATASISLDMGAPAISNHEDGADDWP